MEAEPECCKLVQHCKRRRAASVGWARRLIKKGSRQDLSFSRCCEHCWNDNQRCRITHELSLQCSGRENWFKLRKESYWVKKYQVSSDTTEILLCLEPNEDENAHHTSKFCRFHWRWVKTLRDTDLLNIQIIASTFSNKYFVTYIYCCFLNTALHS